MILLDIAGKGLFSHSGEIFSILGSVLKLVAGSFGIILLALFSFVGIIIASIFKAIEHSSLIHGFRYLIRTTAYAIGICLALVFILVTGIFFSIPFFQLILIAAM